MVMVMVMVVMCEACLHAGSSECTPAVAGVAPTNATADVVAAAAIAVMGSESMVNDSSM